MSDELVDIEEFKKQLTGDVYLVVDDKCYRILEVQEEENLAKALKADFTAALKDMDFAYRRLINETNEKLRDAKIDAKKKGFKAGIELARSLPKEWKLIDTYDNGFVIKYKKCPIYAKRIKKYEDMADIPKEYARKFKLTHLELNITYEPLVFSKGFGRGYYPHLSDGGSRRVVPLCIGDFEGKPFSVPTLQKFVKSLETVNLNSAFDGDSTDLARMIMEDAYNEGRAKRIVWGDSDD